jgi:hypothetical protein
MVRLGDFSSFVPTVNPTSFAMCVEEKEANCCGVHHRVRRRPHAPLHRPRTRRCIRAEPEPLGGGRGQHGVAGRAAARSHAPSSTSASAVPPCCCRTSSRGSRDPSKPTVPLDHVLRFVIGFFLGLSQWESFSMIS